MPAVRSVTALSNPRQHRRCCAAVFHALLVLNLFSRLSAAEAPFVDVSNIVFETGGS